MQQGQPVALISTVTFYLTGLKHAYLFYCSNLVVKSWFLISNSRKHHMGQSIQEWTK